MISLDSIEYIKSIIKNQVMEGKILNSGIPFSKYQKAYFSTNENIKDYINLVPNNSNEALTVLASGDHTFNLLSKNILTIDTFDTNLITEYLFGFKTAMIIKYNYKEYLNIMSKLINKDTPLITITSTINDLLPYMDIKYRVFWKIINEYNYKLQKAEQSNLNLIHLLFINVSDIDTTKSMNDYLTSEEKYNNLRSNIIKSNLTFNNIDAINIADILKSKYDVILMSNIFDYMYKRFGYQYKYNDAKKYIKLLIKMLSKDGILFLNYIFNYCSTNYTRSNVIANSSITITDIPKANIDKVDSIKHKNIKDGIVYLIKK